MNILKETLELAWEKGFFYRLREGQFDRAEFEKINSTLVEVNEDDIDFSDKRLISLLWVIPLFVNWQEERLLKNGISKEEFTAVFNFFYNQCERLLGLP